MEKKMIYDIVVMNGSLFKDDTGISFESKIEAQKYIDKYKTRILPGEYVIKPRERREMYSSLADFELSKKRELEELELQFASLGNEIELPFEIEIKKGEEIVKKTNVLSFEDAELMSHVSDGNGNIIVSLQNGSTFITSLKNYLFIDEQLMKRSHLEHEIKMIKYLLIQKKTELENESEDEME